MKKLLLVGFCFLVLCISQVFAQNHTVTGTVTAKDDGQPLPGVTVKLKGTTVATVTNAAGKYSISAPATGVLVFSFISYQTQELPIKGDVLSVSLNPVAQQLGEVVVTSALLSARLKSLAMLLPMLAVRNLRKHTQQILPMG
jgi:hypothetical protein